MTKLATSSASTSIASRRAAKRSMASTARAYRRRPGTAHVLERGRGARDLLGHHHDRAGRRQRDPRQRLHDHVARLGGLLGALLLVGRRARLVERGGDPRVLEVVV